MRQPKVSEYLGDLIGVHQRLVWVRKRTKISTVIRHQYSFKATRRVAPIVRNIMFDDGAEIPTRTAKHIVVQGAGKLTGL